MIITVDWEDNEPAQVFTPSAFALLTVGPTNPDDDGEHFSESRSGQRFLSSFGDAELYGYLTWAADLTRQKMQEGNHEA